MKYLFVFLISLNLYASINQITGIEINSKKEVKYTPKELHRPLVVIFLSKDCPCSKGNLSYINSLASSYKEFKFVGIHVKKGSTPLDVEKYLSNKKIDFEIINDLDMQMTKEFGALKTPHAFIVAENGEVIYNGGITNTTFPENAKTFFLKEALEDIKNHRPIKNNETKTLGCFIVR